MKKVILIGLFACGVVYAKFDTISYNYKLFSLRQELKDIYAQSRLYEKNSKYGCQIPVSEWEKLHKQAKNVKIEIEKMKKN